MKESGTLMEQSKTIFYGKLAKYMSAKTRVFKIPFSGTLELTPRCNMNCKMCYIRMNEQEMAKVGHELDADEWIRIAREAVDNGMTMVLFTGGEALLYRDFKKVYLAVRKMGVFISINSNGTLLSDQWLEFFKENPPAKFNITIYGGSNETYERLCGNPHGFDQLRHNIEELQKAHIEILLNCTLTKQNVDDMEKIYAFGREHGLKVHATTYNFPPVRKEGVDIEEISRMDPKSAARARIRQDWNELSEQGFAQRINFIAENVEQAEALDNHCVDLEGDKVQCAAGRSNFWITWDGRMLPCGMIPDFSVPVRGRDFKEAWDEVTAHTAEITLAPECRICPKKKICMPCAAKLKAESGVYHQKSEYMCAYVDEYMSLIYKAKEYLSHEKTDC